MSISIIQSSMNPDGSGRRHARMGLAVLALCVGSWGNAAFAQTPATGKRPALPVAQNAVRTGTVAPAAATPLATPNLVAGPPVIKNTGPCFHNNCLYPYEENFHYLASPKQQIPADFFDPLKFIPFDSAGDVYLSLNGQFRPGYFRNLNNLVPTPVGSKNESENRLEFGADLHLGNFVRLYGDLYDGTYIGPSSTPPAVVRNSLTTENAFIEIGNDVNNQSDETHYGIRAGRQLLWFGNGLVVSPSELSVIPNTFQGVRAYMQTSNLRLDAFLVESVVPKQGIEAAAPTAASQLWGLYASYDIPPRFTGTATATVEPFYFGSREAFQTYDDASLEIPGPPGPPNFVTADDVRHSFGVRFYGTAAQFDTDATAVYQTGHFGNQPVSAWSVASDTGYTLANVTATPRLGFQVNAASGGAKAGGAIHTYQPLYWDALYYSDNLNFAPVNFIDFGPHILVKPLPGISLDFNNMWVYRQTTSDAIYQGLFSATTTLNLYSPTANIPGRYVGDQLNLTAMAYIGRHISILFRTGYFMPGAALHAIGATDTASVLLLPSIKF